jgi:MarR family transcriptional regulator, organic hydroperoxide resistance regulator
MTQPHREEDFTLGPTVEFMRSLWRLNHAVEQLSRRMEAAWGVTAQQRLIIRCVGAYPGMTAGQLARQFHLDEGTVSATLGRLERKGLLERRRAQRDRRRLTLGLTASGREVDRVAGTVERAVDDLLQGASGDDVAATRRVLERLAELLEIEARRTPGDPLGRMEQVENFRDTAVAK